VGGHFHGKRPRSKDVVDEREEGELVADGSVGANPQRRPVSDIGPGLMSGRFDGPPTPDRYEFPQRLSRILFVLQAVGHVSRQELIAVTRGKTQNEKETVGWGRSRGGHNMRASES